MYGNCKTNRQRIEQGLEPIPLEEAEALLFASWLRQQGLIFTHIANERKTHIALGAKLKRMGLCKGFPDYLVIVPIEKKKYIVCIEMKRKLKSLSQVSPKQKEWLAALQECEEVESYVAYGADEAIQFIESLIL